MEALQEFSQMSQLSNTPQKDKQNDRILTEKQKYARVQFFQHEVKNKLRQAGATQEEYEFLLMNFTRQKRSMEIGFSKLQGKKMFEKYLQYLQERLNQMEQYYKAKKRECLTILQLIQRKCSALKVIKIQYPQKISQYQIFILPYSLSAFQIFEVVHNNRLLQSVTLKGVEVQRLQQFMRLLNPLNLGYKLEEQRQNWSLIKHFEPLKSLNLTINAQLRFIIDDQQNTRSQVDDLMFFSGFFDYLSNFRAKIRIVHCMQLQNPYNNVLQHLWKSLKNIKQIDIDFDFFYYSSISPANASIIRSIIFQALASFTQIAKLSFNHLCFTEHVEVNDHLAMEQSLSTLFKNNAVTHLRLNHCNNFPILPQIITLQSIDIERLLFRKKNDFMNSIVHSNKLLKSITSSYQNAWALHEQLFEQLQSLIIKQYSMASVENFTSQSPSKIKHLTIHKGNNLKKSVWSLPILSIIFPRLHSLTVLSLVGIGVGHQLLCTIPSPYLQDLYIKGNYVITDLGVKEIDLKWPQLQRLFLQQCSKLSEKPWSICNFKKLKELKVAKKLFLKCKSFQDFLKRGIKVIFIG